MSIPKEPRQLMVNLMYIVLTALLAINVSAEVMQALFSMDKSLNESTKLVKGSNEQLVAAIQEQARAYPQYQSFVEKVNTLQKSVEEFFQYTSNLRVEVINAAGGPDENGLPKQKDNKDISSRLLLKGGKAKELKTIIQNTRSSLLNLVENPTEREHLASNIPLKTPELPPNSDKDTWEQSTFQQMPVAAILPLLSKFQNDVKLTETTILNHFFNQMNMEVVRPDKFYPVISAPKNYIIRGEEYQGEIFLAAYSSTADNLSIKVDGRPLKVNNGKALFTKRAGELGTQNHRMSIEMTNPITGETQTFKNNFAYEVGERSVAVALDKMNVMYVGVENPVTVSVGGVPTEEIRVVSEGLQLQHQGNGKYISIPQKTGNASITVSGGGLSQTLNYRIKKIPDPTLYLGRNQGGNIKLAEFKAQQGIVPILENFDFEARCKIQNFEMTRVRNGDAISAENQGNKFNSKATKLKENAKRNDVFYFDKIKVRCPGDEISRPMLGMFFNIK